MGPQSEHSCPGSHSSQNSPRSCLRRRRHSHHRRQGHRMPKTLSLSAPPRTFRRIPKGQVPSLAQWEPINCQGNPTLTNSFKTLVRCLGREVVRRECPIVQNPHLSSTVSDSPQYLWPLLEDLFLWVPLHHSGAAKEAAVFCRGWLRSWTPPPG